MSKIIYLENYKFPWKEVFHTDDALNSTLYVYVNDTTGEAEVVQMNDDNEVIRTMLTTRELYNLTSVLQKHVIISNERDSSAD